MQSWLRHPEARQKRREAHEGMSDRDIFPVDEGECAVSDQEIGRPQVAMLQRERYVERGQRRATLAPPPPAARCEKADPISNCAKCARLPRGVAQAAVTIVCRDDERDAAWR